MPEAPKMPTIPLPTKGDDNSRFEAILALKQAVEMLMGTRGNVPVTRTYLDNTPPDAIAKGDLWISPKGRISYWNGDQWVLTDVGA